MKKTKTSKRLGCLSMATILVIGSFVVPHRVFAFDESALSLDIDTSTVTVRDTWQQIKNAAIIHLVSQKLIACGKKQMLNGYTVGIGIDSRPRSEVLNKGMVFTPAWETEIIFSDGDDRYVGPWFSSFFGESDGEIECNDRDGLLFNMFVYVLKYRSGMDLNIGDDLSLTSEDRLNVVCDGASWGILRPAKFILTASTYDGEKNCNDPSVERYTGRGMDDAREATLAAIYRLFRLDSGNPYVVDYDNLDYYDEVDGYFLYSKDFEVQCPNAPHTNTYSDGLVKWYRVDNDSGEVSTRYFRKSDLTNKAYSFVGSKKKSCEDLVNRMNELIGPYLQFINSEIGKVCKAGVDEAIEEKRKEIDEKYLQSVSATEAQKADSQLVLDEYDRIQREGEYVARRSSEEGEDEVLERIYAASIDVGPAPMAAPTEYVWTCRSHLPYINVEIQDEGDLADALKNEFYDACYDSDISLPWLICPVINWVSDTVDELSKMLDGFF